MSYSQAWLESPSSIKGILVELVVYDVVATQNKTLYLSTIGYTTTDASVSFSPSISDTPILSESIGLDGSASMAFGDIGLNNSTGDLDDWLDGSKYIWANKSIKVYLGDPFWVCANITEIRTKFLLIFDGVISGVDASSRTRVNIKVRDKLERLNTPVTEVKLGTTGTWNGGQTNQDTILPIVFGEVHNITPLLVDPSLLKYQFSSGTSELLIEIRDDGIPIFNSTTPGGATVNYTDSTFTLAKPLVGPITVSVQGLKTSINLTTGAILANTYTNSIAHIVAVIVSQYGKVSTNLNFNSLTEIDLVNFAAFAEYTQPVGVFVTDRENIINVCTELVASLGSQLVMSRTGKLRILQVGVPISTGIIPSVDITDADMLHHSLEISNRTEVVASTKLGFCKNYTVQSGLASGLPADHKDMFEEEWLTETIIDTTVKTNYSLEADPIQKDTLLLVRADALAEATRLNNYYKVPHTIYKFTGFSKLLSLELGQQVTLYHNRFNLPAGKIGQVISLSPNWARATIDIEVLV